MIRKIIFILLEFFMTPLTKGERIKYELFFCRYKKIIPFKKTIRDCWDNEIKTKYPDIK